MSKEERQFCKVVPTKQQLHACNLQVLLCMEIFAGFMGLLKLSKVSFCMILLQVFPQAELSIMFLSAVFLYYINYHTGLIRFYNLQHKLHIFKVDALFLHTLVC